MTASDREAEARARLVWLRAEIARHDELYFKRATPEISDAAYDALKRELRELAARWPEGGAPGEGIGDDRSGVLSTHRHRERMLSLEKAYTEAELRAFHRRVVTRLGGEPPEFVVEPKYDGLALSVTYAEGRLVRAATRGNGDEGDDVTAAVRRLGLVPAQLRASAEAGAALPVPTLVEVRGEVFLPWAEFDRINRAQVAAGEPTFAHPRNLAVGTVKSQAAEDGVKRTLSVVFYGLGGVEPQTVLPGSHRELLGLLRAWGLPVGEFRRARTADDLWAVVRALGVERGEWAFPSDGVVVKLDSLAERARLGASETAPWWALAYKFSAEQAETRVRAITLQVGRTGVLTPVAELEPVELGGATVARASLHNRAEIARKDVRVGDYVYVEKAGEIIPAVVAVNRARRAAGVEPFVFPEQCPSCSAAVVGVAGEAAVRCPAEACPARVQRRIEHFVAKDCLDIAGVGPAVIEKWVARGWVKNVADLYALKREDLLGLGANVSKSTDRLLAAIEQSKGAPAWRVLHGLGIPQVGAATARELAGKFGPPDRLAEVSRETLLARGVTRGVAEAVTEFFARPENREVVRRLAAVGVWREDTTAAETPETGALTGKVFVFTGTLPTLARSEATERVRAAGGVVRESVSRQTDYVVAGEGGGTKLAEAQRLGVPVIDEAGLLRLLDRR